MPPVSSHLLYCIRDLRNTRDAKSSNIYPLSSTMTCLLTNPLPLSTYSTYSTYYIHVGVCVYVCVCVSCATSSITSQPIPSWLCRAGM